MIALHPAALNPATIRHLEAATGLRAYAGPVSGTAYLRPHPQSPRPQTVDWPQHPRVTWDPTDPRNANVHALGAPLTDNP